MEFLRDEDIEKVESLTETSEDNGIMDSGADPESRLGGPAAVELETPEAWPDHHSRINIETSAKWVIWLRIIGENREYFFQISTNRSISLFSEKRVLPFAVLFLGGIYSAVAAIFYFE